MATFAEYPQHTMASNDFTLYPYPEAWSQDQTYLPTSTFADSTYLNATAFDSYQTQYQYAHPEQFDFSGHDAIAQPKGHLQAPSPANSTSNSFDYSNPPALSTVSDSGASVQSTISSAMGSPSAQAQSIEWNQQHIYPNIVSQSDSLFAATHFDFDPIHVTEKGCVGESSIISSVQPSDRIFRSPITPASATSPVLERIKGMQNAGIVASPTRGSRAASPLQSPFFSQSSDPSLIQPSYSPTQYSGTQFPDAQQQSLPYPAISSPGPIKTSSTSPRAGSVKPQGAGSPCMRQQQPWQPYPQHRNSRRPSVSSVHSRHSQNSMSSDESNKGLCPIATCGRHVKDLKAHMLTHQNERPEKCPIPTCEYHTKGFARKYDKNRHTLTHYKGTMVCGFCPGSGSAAEKSFNRADVFKRHLTSVHNVEQTPPNARRKSPTTASKKPYGSAREVSGMCSTCGLTFASAQDFYEHLDDCVLRVVQQTDPSEAINEKILTDVSKDEQVQQTMEKHMLPTNVDLNAPTSFDDDDEVDDDEEGDEDDANDGTYGSRKSRGNKSRKPDCSRIANNGAITKPIKKGLTYSKNGVPLTSAMSGKGSKRRKNYPLSWGAAPDKMKMKKRVLCVYDGQRRLWKDDMMMDAVHEVRIQLPGEGRAYVTDLDMATMRRAEGLHNATDEEKGPWIQEGDVESLMA